MSWNPAPAMSSTTKPTELCLSVLEYFDGNYTKSLVWLHSVMFYVKINTMVYNTNAKKITFALFYMMKGSATMWTTMFHNKAIAGYEDAMVSAKLVVPMTEKLFGSLGFIGMI